MDATFSAVTPLFSPRAARFRAEKKRNVLVCRFASSSAYDKCRGNCRDFFFLVVWKTIDKFSGIERPSYQADFIKNFKRNFLFSALFESTTIADWFLLNFLKKTKVYLSYRWWEYTNDVTRIRYGFEYFRGLRWSKSFKSSSSNYPHVTLSRRGNFSASEFDCCNYDTANIQLFQSYRRPYRTFISRKTNIPPSDKIWTRRSTRNHRVFPCESTRDVGLAYRDISLSFA